MKRFFILLFLPIYFFQGTCSAGQPALNDIGPQNIQGGHLTHHTAQHCLPEIFGYPDGDFDPQHSSFRDFTREFCFNWSNRDEQQMAAFYFAEYLKMQDAPARNATFLSIAEFARCAYETVKATLVHAPNPEAQAFGMVQGTLGLKAMVWATYDWYMQNGSDGSADDPANPLRTIKTQHELWSEHEYIEKFLTCFPDS